MMKQIIGRKEETNTLEAALRSEQPEMVAVIGRRRVGKTFLIKQTYRDDIDFELTGLQHAKKSEQLQNFIFALRDFFPDFHIDAKPTKTFRLFASSLMDTCETSLTDSLHHFLITPRTMCK